MRETRVLDVRRVFDGFLNVDEATVAYEKRTVPGASRRSGLSVERGDAVGVLVQDGRTGELVLVRQYRYPMERHGEPWLLEIVAGRDRPRRGPGDRGAS